ncbi:MAG: secondary thiamine-phosphate synthase enzyme YjbQ [Myxococcota bacterium]
MLQRLQLNDRSPGLHEITRQLDGFVTASGLQEGLCTLFVQHTSASLLIQENADPAVLRDLEAWLGRLVEEGDALFTHVSEGPDDMPAHVKSALLPTSLCIPVFEGRLQLGTWQGVYLWEHRRRAMERVVLVQLSEA